MITKTETRRLNLIKMLLYIYDKENEKEKKLTDKNSKKEKIRNINEYHKVLGHPSEDTTR